MEAVKYKDLDRFIREVAVPQCMLVSRLYNDHGIKMREHAGYDDLLDWPEFQRLSPGASLALLVKIASLRCSGNDQVVFSKGFGTQQDMSISTHYVKFPRATR